MNEQSASNQNRRHSRKNLVVVGNGMAGLRVIEDLIQIAPDRYHITVFGAEPYPSYNRIMLSPLLSGDKVFDEIQTYTREWYDDKGITLFTADAVRTIDRHRRVVTSSQGREVNYDRLVLATGSNPIVIPVPGYDLPGVISFRDLDDVDLMFAASEGGGKAAVIGGGLLGLEAAYGLHKRGMDVTVVHLMDKLMERQLDAVSSELLQQSLIQRGLSFRIGAQTAAVTSDHNGRANGLIFDDPDEPQLSADLVVMAVGIRPNIDLAKSSELDCEKGIVVNDSMQTSDKRIYAVGECVQHRDTVYGLVGPLWEQSRVCVNHLGSTGRMRYGGSVTATKLKVTGIDIYSAGDFSESEDTQVLTYADYHRGVYKRIVLKDDRIAGLVLYGAVHDGPWYFELMQAGTDITDIRDLLIFGRAFVESGRADTHAAEAA